MTIRMSEQYQELPREECEKDPVLMRLLRMGLYDWTDKDARLNQVGFSLPVLWAQDNKIPLVCPINVIYPSHRFAPLSEVDGTRGQGA